MKTLISLMALIWASSALAMVKSGVQFKDSLSYRKTPLVLNGLGVREATIFNIEVYVAGIYLTEKTKDAQKVLSLKTPKVFKMKFLRDVSSDKINSAWEGALENKGLNTELQELKSATQNLKEGDELMFTFGGGIVNYYHNKKRVAKFKNAKLRRALLNIWFGEDPPNESLKSGLLGI